MDLNFKTSNTWSCLGNSGSLYYGQVMHTYSFYLPYYLSLFLILHLLIRPDSPLTMKRLTLLLFCFLQAVLFFGQIDSSDVNLSPYGVIYNHLYYLQDDSYQPERAALSFPDDVADREKLAIQLIKILDGKGYYVDINRLPANNDHLDSASQEAIYIIDSDEPRIYVEKVGNQWFYSRTTIQEIPVLFEEVFPLGTGFATTFHGPFWDFELLNISVAKWLGLFLLAVVSCFVFYLVNWISKMVIISFLKKRMGIPEKVNKSLNRLARIFGLLLTTRVLLYFLPMFQLPVRLNAFLLKAIGILSIFFLILLISQIAKIAFHYFDYLTKKTENTLDDQLMPVLSRIVDIIIWAVGIIYILEFLDVNVTALLAGISIGGLAIALAAQDTVKNFFGSLMIFVDRPFQIGDWISFEGVDGIVEEVGVRSTRIRTFANSLVYVPNGRLADRTVNNWGLRQYRRFKTDLGVTYNTPPAIIDLFVKGIREIIKKHPTTRKDYFEVHLNSFGASSINILLYCFFEAPNWTAELKAKHEVMYAILTLAEDLGVNFAFPSQSVYIESFNKDNLESRNSGSLKGEKQLSTSLDKIDEYFKTDNLQSKADKIKPLGGE